MREVIPAAHRLVLLGPRGRRTQPLHRGASEGKQSAGPGGGAGGSRRQSRAVAWPGSGVDFEGEQAQP